MQLLSFIKKKFILTLIAFVLVGVSYSATVTINKKLNWTIYKDYSFSKISYPFFITFNEASFYKSTFNSLPIFTTIQSISNEKGTKVFLKNEIYEAIDASINFQNKDFVKQASPEIVHSIGYEKGIPKIIIYFLPLRFNNLTGVYEKLISFDIVIEYADEPRLNNFFGKKGFTSNSVLASGEWYKIAVVNNGIHKIDSTFFNKNNINISDINPKTFRIFGNGAGMLPMLNATNRLDDLQENAIYVEGEADNKFDPTDFILFYGQSQFDRWTFDSSSQKYFHQNNIYSDTTYYFITFGNALGKRITKQTTAPTANKQTSEFDFNLVHENESRNLIKSGNLWFGEEFNQVVQQNFSVNMGTINLSENIFMRSSVAARSFTPSNFYVSINNGTNIITHSIGLVTANFEYPYAAEDNPQNATFFASSSNFNVSYTYSQPIAGSMGWLDYFELQSRNYLNMNAAQLNFRDIRTVASGNITQFNIANASSNLRVWELSNLLSPLELITTINGSTASIISQTDTLKEFIAFDGTKYYSPIFVGKVNNQNLHALPPTDYIILTHPQFINEATQLANLYSGKLRVQVVLTDQIYNEFSSGAQDICAIRDFMKMLYLQAITANDKPKYLLLFGRASYDFKYRTLNNTNYVPTYESVESFDPVSSYNSDDFFGFLDDNEGTWDSPTDSGTKHDFLDIGIGRLPAQNNKQAQDMVNKIIGYKANKNFGDWRNRITFVTDGGADGASFISLSEGLTNSIQSNSKNYNFEKIYGDAFNIVEEAGGARNPDAQAEIVKSVERGSMFINYTGHGGQAGWSAERILNTDDINSWTNGLNLPLFLTATCQFAPFDDPSLTSAGEMVLLNPNGGGIALFSTVRLTEAGANSNLNHSFFKYAGFDSAGVNNRLNIGDIMMKTKNDYSGTINDRNFTLLGDPAMMLNYPTYKVATTAINSKPVSSVADTMKAFAKVTVDGTVTDLNGNPLNNYNGVVYPTVFDKTQTYYTLGSNHIPFNVQKNVLYRGKASVQNGVFHFSFIVPKDITYQNGFGKISYYANTENSNASGYYENFIVGGTSDSISVDKTGPQINLYMNDEKFVNGGLTNENPLFIAKLKDENGINITGTGIGRDLLLTITNSETNKSITVNDYYQAKLNTYQEGSVNYPFKKLPQGNNTVKLRAWDVYNNISESQLDFVVATSEELALKHVLNFPNPFTTFTTFHFDHNKAGEAITVSIQIFTISGKLVKTLHAETTAATGHFDQLTWDGKDDFNDAIGKGVYIYKVRIKSNEGKTAEEFQKLVILN